MLVHLCTDCGNVSINRIAADDDADTIMELFTSSLTLPVRICNLLLDKEIDILSQVDLPVLQLQLFGSDRYVRMPELA